MRVRKCLDRFTHIQGMFPVPGKLNWALQNKLSIP
jgi:hypothetical protein